MPDVTKVTVLGGHRLRLEFADGVSGELDFASWLTFRGVFEPLKDPARFAEVRVDPDAGTIVWPTGADLCPEVLYSRVTGKSIPWETGEDGS
jgi:hypothetical protein